MTTIAHITILAAVDDDVTAQQIHADLVNELGASTYLSDVNDYRIRVSDSLRYVTFRGSETSARIVADYVNGVDAVQERAGHGKRYATAEATIEEIRVGDYSQASVRVDRSALCRVDAYDGIHELSDGETLVADADGWHVERATS